jgi:predicted SnoaL-like aldol condensation-catalyzing enzyme
MARSSSHWDVVPDRLENGKIVEHWDVVPEVPEHAANQNTMF